MEFPKDLRNENCYFYRMPNRFLHRFFPPSSISREITIEGPNLTIKAGYLVKNSIYLHALPLFIPDCRSYVVEYSLAVDGEFEAVADAGGGAALYSRHDPARRIPVCWLPPSFAGKRVDRTILMIDRKRTRLRIGLSPRRLAA